MLLISLFYSGVAQVTVIIVVSLLAWGILLHYMGNITTLHGRVQTQQLQQRVCIKLQCCSLLQGCIHTLEILVINTG